MAKMASATTDEIINTIAVIRANNNWLWMDILRIAAEVDPKRTRKITKEITLNDRKVTKWLQKL